MFLASKMINSLQFDSALKAKPISHPSSSFPFPLGNAINSGSPTKYRGPPDQTSCCPVSKSDLVKVWKGWLLEGCEEAHM
eukprot:CAMPEP_0196594096 /NCGR_PEP_ID=MMETSP1081-20130531/77364_1 /TAXON_ID=36882 /ORGANISM="Pyramimonas amylifera, Strain CCMP720" /LENGTH=79 /DNA_ID=CAMNT_0041918259 /DNA_START=101 /DNA_END=340 /DNA_ORIENTATION=-